MQDFQQQYIQHQQQDQQHQQPLSFLTLPGSELVEPALPPGLKGLAAIHALVARIVHTLPDMRECNNDDPEDFPEDLPAPQSAAPSGPKPPATPPPQLGCTPTPRQAWRKYQLAENEAKAQLWKNLQAGGVQPLQHSVEDYLLVVRLQLDKQDQGENPGADALLQEAFPNQPKKAKSLGSSRRGDRMKLALASAEVKTHPVERVMQAVHGTRRMNQRGSATNFRQCLTLGGTLFDTCDRITRLEMKDREKDARIAALEAEVAEMKRGQQATKNREALDDAGHTSTKEKVLALRDRGMQQAEIARELDMPKETVKTILRRAKGQ